MHVTLTVFLLVEMCLHLKPTVFRPWVVHDFVHVAFRWIASSVCFMVLSHIVVLFFGIIVFVFWGKSFNL